MAARLFTAIVLPRIVSSHLFFTIPLARHFFTEQSDVALLTLFNEIEALLSRFPGKVLINNIATRVNHRVTTE